MSPNSHWQPLARAGVAVAAMLGVLTFAASSAFVAVGVQHLRGQPERKVPRLGIPAGERPTNVSTVPTGK